MQRLGDYIKEYSARNKFDEEIPVYSVTNSNGFCRDYFGKEVASNNKRTYKIVPRNAFAYNPSRINVGSVDYQHYEDRVIVSPLYNVFTVDEKILPQYLYFYLKSPNTMKRIRTVASGSVRDNLKLSMLCEFPIQVPSINRQQNIIEILEKTQRIIDEKNDELEKLDNLIKARFVEMFRRNNIYVISVGDAVELINGRAFKPTHWMADGLPIIRIQNLNDKTAPFNYFDGIYDKKNYVKKGELLFSWSGTPGTSFGAFIWDREPGILNQHIFRVLPKIDLELNYLRYALNDQLEIIISKAHGGVGLQHITKGELEKVLIPNPNIEQQHSFSNFVAQVDKSKFVLSNELTMCDFYIRLIHDRVMHSRINLRVTQ